MSPERYCIWLSIVRTWNFICSFGDYFISKRNSLSLQCYGNILSKLCDILHFINLRNGPRLRQKTDFYHEMLWPFNFQLSTQESPMIRGNWIWASSRAMMMTECQFPIKGLFQASLNLFWTFHFILDNSITINCIKHLCQMQTVGCSLKSTDDSTKLLYHSYP